MFRIDKFIGSYYNIFQCPSLVGPRVLEIGSYFLQLRILKGRSGLVLAAVQSWGDQTRQMLFITTYSIKHLILGTLPKVNRVMPFPFRVRY